MTRRHELADTLSSEERSRRMAKIRSSDTKPEIALRRGLHRLGLRFRLGGAGLPGRPDIVLPRYKAVVFVHGCFWHRHHACKVASTPKSNTDFWLAKFDRNVIRDQEAVEALESLGWRVFIAWECELATSAKLALTSDRLASSIRDTRPACGSR